jgi:hypothetical protein
MNSALAISAAGIQTASSQFGTAAAQLVAAYTPLQRTRPNSTPTNPGRASLSPTAATYADPATPMVSMMQARVSYGANIAAFKLADRAYQSLLDIVA